MAIADRGLKVKVIGQGQDHGSANAVGPISQFFSSSSCDVMTHSCSDGFFIFEEKSRRLRNLFSERFSSFSGFPNFSFLQHIKVLFLYYFIPPIRRPQESCIRWRRERGKEALGEAMRPGATITVAA